MSSKIVSFVAVCVFSLLVMTAICTALPQPGYGYGPIAIGYSHQRLGYPLYGGYGLGGGLGYGGIGLGGFGGGYGYGAGFGR